MKNIKIWLLITTFSISGFSGCKKENMGDCLKSTGSVQTEIRDLPDFNRLEVEDNINVFIRFGGPHRAEIEAGKNLLELIETEVEGNTLHIRNNNKCNWVRSYKHPIDITLYCDELDELIAHGYGTVETLDTLVQTSFLAEQWLASGMIKLLLNTDEVYLKSHTGPADFECRGHSDFLYAYNSSQGILKLDGVQAQNAFVWNTGTGDIYVNASDSLEILIENVGDVYYTGQPGYVSSTINHDGEAIPF